MKPNLRFVDKNTSFWAHARSVSQSLGYTDRKTKRILSHSLIEITIALDRLGLGKQQIVLKNGRATALGRELVAYFEHRAHVLNN